MIHKNFCVPKHNHIRSISEGYERVKTGVKLLKIQFCPYINNLMAIGGPRPHLAAILSQAAHSLITLLFNDACTFQINITC